MNKPLTIQDLEDKGLILYKHIAGSNLFGLQTETSDLDIHGVYLAPTETLLGLGDRYQEIIQDEKNDVVYHELRKFIDLLCKSNPTMLEMLYVPKDKILGDVHPIIQKIIDNRDMFLTKQCFKPFVGYAIEQIKKARGLNKKCTMQIVERKKPIDFCYTFYGQGSTKIHNWLEYRGLKQNYCGLVKIPNMHEVYGVYYDFKKHLLSLTEEDKTNESYSKFLRFCLEYFNGIGCNFEFKSEILCEINNLPDVKYFGIFKDLEKSNEVCLSSVSKGETPICYITFNESGYSAHCKDYRGYKEWEKCRNPHRYANNLVNNYDTKNLSHTFRLLQMGIEIARGEGFNVVRTHDNQFLRDIKSGKFEYDYLIGLAEKKKQEMDEAIKTCTLPEEIDKDAVNDLLVSVRIEAMN
jgi:predicted nucleotidyltransferase